MEIAIPLIAVEILSVIGVVDMFGGCIIALTSAPYSKRGIIGMGLMMVGGIIAILTIPSCIGMYSYFGSIVDAEMQQIISSIPVVRVVP